MTRQELLDAGVLIDDQDLSWLDTNNWFIGDNGIYAHSGTTSSRETVYLSRLIMSAPSDKLVDHINGNHLDNRRSNLRLCNKAQNCRNQKLRSDNSSGYKGVYRVRNKWQAQIKMEGRMKSLGVYVDIADAAKAYNDKARELYGEFAKLNPI